MYHVSENNYRVMYMSIAVESGNHGGVSVAAVEYVPIVCLLLRDAGPLMLPAQLQVVSVPC